MKKQFATYEIALAMKELGFDEPCLGYFPNVENSDKTMIFFDRVPEYTINSLFDKNPTNYHFTAPLWQQCVDWFRENQNINVEINYLPNIKKYGILSSSIDIRPRDLTQNENTKRGIEITNNYARYDTYQEAREQAILKCIELCKQKEQ